MTVLDYCGDMEKRAIVINRDYQRSDKVWPPVARSFLIETILLNLPMPKFWLHQVTDVASKTTKKEIVDGQQRSRAILDFFKGDLTLATTLDLEEAAGRTYEELPPDLQATFLDYGLAVDLFVGATPEQVRDIFRRMNSYTVPLYPEEQRHARNQGPFKWFIFRLTRDYSQALINMGIFREKQVIRMADAKLLTEIADALVNSIRTTNGRLLDKLYESRDVAFDEEPEFDHRFCGAIDFLVELPELHGTNLMRSYVAYGLILAIMHLQNPVPSLIDAMPVQPEASFDRDRALANLGALSESLDLDEDEWSQSPFEEFARASKIGTNVGAKRQIRARWLYRALVETLPV
jgi:hypothetical protein